jgi:pimeloyl-ACP methyl ester carboxylesterase
MLIESTFDTGEISLHYAQWINDAPNGVPLVLLHGVTQSWRHWIPLIEKLGNGHPVFALDSRGHGRSGWLEDGYRFIDYPHDQQMFLREIVRAPAVLIGHSLGGMNALYIAAETPELVRAIVLEDPPLYFEQGLSVFEPIFRAIKALAESNLPVENLALKVAEVTRAPLEFARAHAEYIVQLDPQTLGQLLDGSAFELWRTDALLARIACPTLLLYGEAARGGALTVAQVEHAKQRLDQCRTVFIKDTGHMLHTYKPDAFLQAVQPFLEKV